MSTKTGQNSANRNQDYTITLTLKEWESLVGPILEYYDATGKPARPRYANYPDYLSTALNARKRIKTQIKCDYEFLKRSGLRSV